MSAQHTCAHTRNMNTASGFQLHLRAHTHTHTHTHTDIQPALRSAQEGHLHKTALLCLYVCASDHRRYKARVLAPLDTLLTEVRYMCCPSVCSCMHELSLRVCSCATCGWPQSPAHLACVYCVCISGHRQDCEATRCGLSYQRLCIAMCSEPK